jgi:hypothetical protein
VLRRYLRIVGLALACLGYVWFAAVRHSNAVKSKKADRREATRRIRG